MTEAIAKAKKARIKKKTANRRKRTDWPGWFRLIPERCTKNLATRKSFLSSFVALSIPAQTTHAEEIRMIAAGANIPFPIESLGDELDTGKVSRGHPYFKYLGDVVDEMAEIIPNMRWWLTEKGLNMAVVPPDCTLSPLDAIAVELCLKHWTTPTLSKATLQLIARELDEKTASLAGDFLDRFPPKASDGLKKYNRSYPKQAITTFERAAAHPQFTRNVRKILYVARARYEKARRRVSNF
jgi:hypothetical protein